MPDSIFNFVANDSQGRKVQGRITANNADAAEYQLVAKGYSMIVIETFYTPGDSGEAETTIGLHG